VLAAQTIGAPGDAPPEQQPLVFEKAVPGCPNPPPRGSEGSSRTFLIWQVPFAEKGGIAALREASRFQPVTL
jgi:hypothetical protein